MKKTYRSIEEVLQSPWASLGIDAQEQKTTDRVLRSSKLEDSIYAELREEDMELEEVEKTAAQKLHDSPVQVIITHAGLLGRPLPGVLASSRMPAIPTNCKI